MDGNTITGLDAQGQQVFSHTYKLLDQENENGFIFYESEDADSGEFTYFAFSPDTMETTYHLEFRYAESLDDLQSWFEGSYAYWNAAGIAENYDEATMKNVIELFATENLSSHAMNAVEEMGALNRDLKKFFDKNGAEYPAWRALEKECGNVWGKQNAV